MVHTKTFLSEWKDEAGFPWGMSEADLDVPMPSASWWVQSRVQEVDGVWSCDLDDCDAVTVNAMRRWLLTDVPVVCFRTETEAVNGCRIEVNTSRLHNEMLKHRLSCVPVHLLPEAGLHDTIEVVLDSAGDRDGDAVGRGTGREIGEGEGEGEGVRYITTEHLQVREKATGVFWDVERVRGVFPPDAKTGMFIDLVRLRPGERVAWVAQLSVATARDNAMFNAVSLCTFEARQDMDAVKRELVGKDEGEKRDFLALEAQRRVLPRAWTFRMLSVGPRTPGQLWTLAETELKREMSMPLEVRDTVPPMMLLFRHGFHMHHALWLAQRALACPLVRFAAPLLRHPSDTHCVLKLSLSQHDALHTLLHFLYAYTLQN
ncbi:MAG: hypothetical protein EBR81_15280 [Proteobacteria bacterium]|nr:hypothetical protein [Pseudomonadota bacterium]